MTELGSRQTSIVRLLAEPDFIMSPIMLLFRGLSYLSNSINSLVKEVELQFWLDLREAHEVIGNQGLARVDMAAKFPNFDFSTFPEEWDYPPHDSEGATTRAERVWQR